jgi:hypothetical protein
MRFFVFQKNRALLLSVLSFLFVSVAYFSQGNQSVYYLFNTMGSLLFCISFFFVSPEESLIILIFFIPFRSFAQIYHYSSSLFVFSFACLRILLKSTKSRCPSVLLVFLLFLLYEEFFGDFFQGKIVSFLYIASYISYFCLFILFSKDIDYRKVVVALKIASFLGVCLVIASENVQIVKYFQFGNEERFGIKSVLGSMDVPLYCILLFSLSLNDFLLIKKKPIIYYGVNLFLALFSVIFGSITISKMFFSVSLLFFILYYFGLLFFREKRYVFTLGLAALLALFLLILFRDRFASLLSALLARFSSNFFTNRTSIYQDSFAFLGSRPLGFLFGFGMAGYPASGGSFFYYTYYTAHNLYLDVILGWGLFGAFIVLSFLRYFYLKQATRNIAFKNSYFCWIPMLGYLSACLSEGSFSSANTYIFLLALICCAFSYPQTHPSLEFRATPCQDIS